MKKWRKNPRRKACFRSLLAMRGTEMRLVVHAFGRDGEERNEEIERGKKAQRHANEQKPR